MRQPPAPWSSPHKGETSDNRGKRGAERPEGTPRSRREERRNDRGGQAKGRGTVREERPRPPAPAQREREALGGGFPPGG